MSALGKYLVFIGILIIIIGLILWFFADKFSWFGNLPGDIKYERKNFTFYAPIVTMLIISVILSFFFWLIYKFFK